MSNHDISATRVRELLDYDPETGVFTRKVTQGNAKAGATAGYLDKSNGYVTISIDGKKCYAHRLAWLYVYGTWPEAEIDHMNRQRSCNRIGNLRAATHRQNLQNTTQPSNNTSGCKGVSLIKRTGKWEAFIKTYGKKRHLGVFTTFAEAAAARRTAEASLHPFKAPSPQAIR